MRPGGISRLYKAIERVRELNPDFAISQLSLFLYVVQHEGITLHEVAEALRIPQGTVSRNTKQLGRYIVTREDGTKEVRGYGLLRTEPDMEERRRLAVYLTKDGKQLVNDLEMILYG